MQWSIVVLEYEILILFVFTMVVLGTSYKRVSILLQQRKIFLFTLLVYITFLRCLLTHSCKEWVNIETMLNPVQSRFQQLRSEIGTDHIHSSLNAIQRRHPRPSSILILFLARDPFKLSAVWFTLSFLLHGTETNTRRASTLSKGSYIPCSEETNSSASRLFRAILLSSKKAPATHCMERCSIPYQLQTNLWHPIFDHSQHRMEHLGPHHCWRYVECTTVWNQFIQTQTNGWKLHVNKPEWTHIPASTGQVHLSDCKTNVRRQKHENPGIPTIMEAQIEYHVHRSPITDKDKKWQNFDIEIS